MPFGDRHADGGRKPLPQRSGGRFDSGKLEIFRMSGAWTVKLTEIADIVHRRTDITRQIQKGVDQHRPMPCRQHETVAVGPVGTARVVLQMRSEEHTSELQSLMRISYAVFCLKKKT